MKYLYILLGFLFFALGAIGAVVPVLPTTPFLLLAAFFFARGSERFNRWFLSTSLYKKHLEAFVRSRSMTRASKVLTLGFASSMLAIAFIATELLYLRLFILLVAVYKYYYFATRIKTIAPDKPRKPSKMMNGRLLSLVEHSRRYILLGVAVNWIGLLANIAAVISIAILLQRVWEGRPTGKLVLVAGSITALALAVRLLCSYLATMLAYRASVNAKKSLRSQIYRKLLKLGSSYRSKVSTSEVVQVAVDGVEQLEHYFGRYMPQLFYSLLAPATLFAVLSFISLKAAVILLVCVPLIPVSIIAIMRIAKRLFRKYWGIYVNLGDSFLENLQGLTTFKIYRADERRHEEMNRAAEDFRKVTMKVLTMQLNSVAIMDLIAFGGAGLGAGIAAYELAAGRIGLWGALAIVLLSAEFFIPLRLLGSFFHIAMNGMAASDNIFRLLDMKAEEEGAAPISEGDIRLERLSFGYEPDRPVLRNVSLHIPRGSLVSIVGESGSGKSTLAALMAGRERDYTGGLAIGGTELSAAAGESIMKHVTWIGHNSYIFRGTVEENLRMAAPQASETDMLEALGQVELREFVLMQGGLSCVLEDQGSNLSGGQRQRLALARALLHDSPVYIFDEATSNIDVESENSILKVIHSLAGKKTVVLISHRLANVVESDCIYVLAGGEVAESGTHTRLMEREGLYARLFLGQRSIEEYVQGGGVYA
ncbi:DUF454 family protein [Paenibacillus sp. YN15]|uniref:DUF454 family protein n=1 Tax=Paenibacillus sp. YN15 TaxID=1742774 RepID=UPI000DCB0322|nr:DUF454 family protein [Paenibacillus sp. YN15]RAU99861.1 cysteine ABC transporter ATP-binding protein [Paenibacillus sp. YN15]